MSDFIIGFTNSITPKDISNITKNIQKHSLLGFEFNQNKVALHGFPDDLIKEDIQKFYISDFQGANTAGMYLYDLDYDPFYDDEDDFQKSIPALLKDRIKNILSILDILLLYEKINLLVISINRCYEIENIKRCNIDDYTKIIMDDCLSSCPPNNLYIINK